MVASLTLPLRELAAMRYLVPPGGRMSVMLPLLVFSRTLPGTLASVIWRSPLPLEAVIVSVPMKDPEMLPLSVFAVIVVDVTPLARMSPLPDEADSTVDLLALTAMLPLPVFRVSGPDVWLTDRSPLPVESLTGPVMPVTVASPAPLLAVSVVTVAGTAAVASSSQSPVGIGQR